MSVSINNFVNVNLSRKIATASNYARDTAIFVTKYTTKFKKDEDTNYWYADIRNAVYNNYTEWLQSFTGNPGSSDISESSRDIIANYSKIIQDFFNAAPDRKLRVIEGCFIDPTTKSTDDQVLDGSSTSNLIAQLRETDDKEIVLFTDILYGDVSGFPTAVNQGRTDINKKKIAIMGCTTISSTPSANDYLVVRYGGVYYAMATAIYLTKIKFNSQDSVKDYTYTQEMLELDDYIVDDDTTYQTYTSYNVCFDVKIANNIYTVNGDTTSNISLVNQYCYIVLHQILQESVFNVISQKIKGERGLSLIRSALSQQLDRFVLNGYLSTDKVWKEDDLTFTYNNREYLLISQNTPLTKGYLIVIPSISSLSDEDKNSTPPIKVVIAESDGIRTADISGYVI